MSFLFHRVSHRGCHRLRWVRNLVGSLGWRKTGVPVEKPLKNQQQTQLRLRLLRTQQNEHILFHLRHEQLININSSQLI